MDNNAKIMLKGYVPFLALLFVGLYLLYDPSSGVQNLPFVVTYFANSIWTYNDFVTFWFFFVIIPIGFWWFCIRTLKKVDVKPRRGFRR